MTDQLPKQFFVWSFNDWDNWGGYARTTNLHPLDDKERETGVLCVPRSQADAMVAAAFEQAQHTAQIAWNWPESEASSAPVCEAIAKLTPADARAAFEQAVQEARDEGFTSGRENGFEEGRAMAHQHDKIFDEVATEIQVREAVEAERERVISFSLDGGPDLRSLLLHYHEKWVTETEAEAETDRHLAAIRAPEETSE